MAIQALALLRIAPPAMPVMPVMHASVQIDRLDDAVIIHTGDDFGEEPDELVETLLAIVGPEALHAHQDPRGILFIPHVAAPTARTYEAVVAEVGEGGVWGSSAALQDGPAEYGDIGALLGNVFANLPPSVMAAASSAAQGDQASLEAMAAQVQALLGSSPALQSLAGQLSGMLGQTGPAPTAPQAGSEMASLEDMFASFGGGADANAVLRKMASSMEAEFERDPEKMAQLASSLLGAQEPAKKK